MSSPSRVEQDSDLGEGSASHFRLMGRPPKGVLFQEQLSSYDMAKLALFLLMS